MRRLNPLPNVSATWFRLAGVPALILASPLATDGAQAQSANPVTRTVGFAVGASSYDASGTGTAPTIALRVDAPLWARWLLVEGSMGYAPFDEQFSESSTSFGVLEGQLQLQLPASRVRPYLGLGAGLATYLSNAAGRGTTGTASVAAGVRVPATSRVLVRAELRVRGWEPHGTDGFAGAAAETTVGMAWRF